MKAAKPKDRLSSALGIVGALLTGVPMFFVAGISNASSICLAVLFATVGFFLASKIPEIVTSKIPELVTNVRAAQRTGVLTGARLLRNAVTYSVAGGVIGTALGPIMAFVYTLPSEYARNSSSGRIFCVLTIPLVQQHMAEAVFPGMVFFAILGACWSTATLILAPGGEDIVDKKASILALIGMGLFIGVGMVFMVVLPTALIVPITQTLGGALAGMLYSIPLSVLLWYKHVRKAIDQGITTRGHKFAYSIGWFIAVLAGGAILGGIFGQAVIQAMLDALFA